MTRMKLFFFIVLFFTFDFNFVETKCEIKYSFKKLCHFYIITNTKNCNEQNLIGCKIYKTTRHEQKCPTFICQIEKVV